MLCKCCFIERDGDATPPKQFGALPEYFVDDMAEFILFVSE